MGEITIQKINTQVKEINNVLAEIKKDEPNAFAEACQILEEHGSKYFKSDRYSEFKKSLIDSYEDRLEESRRQADKEMEIAKKELIRIKKNLLRIRRRLLNKTNSLFSGKARETRNGNSKTARRMRRANVKVRAPKARAPRAADGKTAKVKAAEVPKIDVRKLPKGKG